MANWDRNAVWRGVERRGDHNVLLFQLQAAPKYERIIYQAAPPLSNTAFPSLGTRIMLSISISLTHSLSLCLLSACGFEIGYNNAVINGCQSERVNKCQAREDADKTPIDSDNNSNNYNNNDSTSRENSNNNNCYETEVRLDSIYGFNTLKLPVPCQEEIQHLPRNRCSQKFSGLLGLSNVRQ